MLYLQDENAQAKPLMRIDPLPPSDSDFFRFTNNGNYLVIKDYTTDNGIVHTTLGDGATGSITGFTIQDSTLKSRVNALLSGVTASSVAGPWALIYSSNNNVGSARIVGWNDASGGLSFEGFMGGNILTYNGSYASFVLCGLPGVTLSNGEYAVDLTNGITAGRVLYKPTNGNASDGRIPCVDWAFAPSGITNSVVLDGLILEGNSLRSTTSGMIRDQAGGSFG
jgi:hypothetical protein